MTRALRAEDGLTYPTGGGLHWLIVDDNSDPEATYPDYAGEAPTLALALQYAASDDLLAALEALTNLCEERMPSGPPLATAMGTAYAALAKARGES